MSGRPYPEGVQSVLGLLNDMNALEDEASRLQVSIEAAQKRLDEARSEIAIRRRGVYDQMDRMDLTQSGNTGHEHRMRAFLQMLVGQAHENGAREA